MVRRLYISDCHWPDVDKKAFNTMMAVGRDFKPTQVIILGDWFDMYSVSSFDKSPTKVVSDLQEELVTGKEAIKQVMSELKPKHLFFLEGNHSFRLTRYVQQHSALIHTLIPPMPELFELPKNSTFVPYGEFLDFDGLSVCHGIAVGRQCTTKMLDLLGTSVLTGHTHRLAYSSKRLYGGKIIHSYSAGWLGALEEAEYMKHRHADWQHGFATSIHSKSGRWAVQLHAIQDGYCIAFDKEYAPYYKRSSR